MKETDRRAFLKIAGASIGVGALLKFAPALEAGSKGAELARQIRNRTGEAPRPFSFVQLSDTHVGFNGPPDPLGTRAFEEAVRTINALPEQPDLVLVTGDLTHDSEDRGEHAARMKKFQEIASGLRVKNVKLIPGEHDAGLDGGALFRDVYGETHYSFDHKGVHFVALDNVSRAKPEVGREQIEWLKKDIGRFDPAAPIVLFTHRPLFDLKPEWEWFTNDGDDVMNAVSKYRNVTVLYGHIHRHQVTQVAGATHYGAKSLIFAFPDPDSGVEKKPLAFDKAHPFAHLGIRQVQAGSPSATVEEIELTAREFAGMAGIQQFLRKEVV
ncbi:MAG TPA: metallophosphoesterase [Thermoanaerobaculia bacterium]|nr:metallophosphoesterase [Thermoanaerobaculia bacterium]